MNFLKSLDRPIVFFDLETTGVDVNNDRIVQFCFAKFSKVNTHGSLLQKLVNPTISISQGAADVHKITNEMVENEPTFAQFAEKIKEFIGDSHIAGFNSNNFDIPLLINEFNRCGIAWRPTGRIIDVSNIYRQQFTRTLADAYKTYTGKTLENAHDAVADILATVEIFEKQFDMMSELQTFEEIELYSNYNKKLADFSGKFYYNDNNELLFAFGKCKDMRVTDNIDYCNWFLRNDFPQESKQVLIDYLKK